jgi:hypothetical protein
MMDRYSYRLEVGAESSVWVPEPSEEHNCWQSSQSGTAAEE